MGSNSSSDASQPEDLKVRFAPIPEPCRPLVGRYGKPDVFLYEEMSVLIWSCGFHESFDSQGAILCRVDDDQSWDTAVAQIEDLSRRLVGNGRWASSIIANSCSADHNPWSRYDLKWTKDVVCGDELRWVAITDQPSISTAIDVEELFSYGDEVEDYHWLDRPDVGTVIALNDLS